MSNPAPELQPGVILAATYRLEELLGKGGMGEVWLVTHLLLDEKRAIKLILGEYAANLQVRERFIRGEARNALRLFHPNIVRVYDLGQHKDMPYIVMEYVPKGAYGADLRSLLRAEGKLSLERTGEILNQLAAALDHAHNQGLIHRDLKPANILLSDQGQVKLTDFGIVKDLKAQDEYLTSEGFAVGTPVYMSPEQARGEAIVASDIYALGVVIYEMLAGRPPFVGLATSVVLQHTTTPPTPLRHYDPSIPDGISEVILKALAKPPQERYSSALELAQAFETTLKENRPTIDTTTIAISTTPARRSRELTQNTPISTDTTAKIRILIADDHPLFRDGLHILLDSVPDMEVIGEVASGDEVLNQVATFAPDVILMDINMPGINGIEATRRLVQTYPQLKVLIITMFEDDDSVFAAMRAGAKGYLLKGAAQGETLRAIRVIAEGEAFFGAAIAQRLMTYFQGIKPSIANQSPLLAELTEREHEILTLMAQRLSNPEIATRLFLSPKTVRNQVSIILSKLQVADRAEAMRAAWTAGLGKDSEGTNL
ncbi:MAG: protein kinase [Chloroflexi bacterium]|uniref:non-specific serine/threonine protein kinase n=1 Tax=Candidatus Chlorohelix allophototropha TaxID=3003348 RepID=A0A8T7M4J3_9CHLR|nr:protein kinase [Chloroflexota bacterium]